MHITSNPKLLKIGLGMVMGGAVGLVLENLRLVRRYNKLVESYNKLVERANKNAEDYNELLRRGRKLDEQFAYLVYLLNEKNVDLTEFDLIALPNVNVTPKEN